MAHQLTYRKNGYVEFAATGPRSAVWHQLGQYIPEGASVEEMKAAAGMDWMIEKSPVLFNNGQDIQTDESRNVLYRSDSKDVLSVVSSEYHIVQPSEVLEFFDEFVKANSMKLSAAGTLFGGKRFWATAELQKDAFVVEGDKVEGYLLLVTSADGTLATQARFTSTRVVCSNTLQVSLGAESAKAVKQHHGRKFDPRQMKLDMGLIDSQWNTFIDKLRNLADTKVQDYQAQAFFNKLINPQAAAELNMGQQRKLDALLHFYKSGAGAEYSHGTAWGLLNAVTELETHGTGRSDPSHQFNKSEMGTGAVTKLQALQMLETANFA